MDRSSPYRLSLARFVAAQGGVYDLALAELRAGAKRTHWMWFVLPQLRGLGTSMMADRYGLEGLDEARAYLSDPILGERLRECVSALLAHAGSRSSADVMGVIDAIKLHSSLTLFEAAGGGPLFTSAIDAFYGSERDRRTLARLNPRRRA
ncbi:DUF1810 domain-containing protein [Sphingomonas glaciei]|uniref:DUF1810 domain-containing protein n=1 Tax=Sphingomonas glaciei TaxID=2938948 RepID=A0ABY5MT54_9SPHN|nr:DUF1810 domain-containing protein [Sphingomonas glaciei]UUR07343.1 DUF1810 domain-containing protein [Sphingomonas glaciei]